MSYKGVCRTAPATAGLLIMIMIMVLMMIMMMMKNLMGWLYDGFDCLLCIVLHHYNYKD